MANQKPLMHPLRTENLHPRPIAQAQYEPPAQTEEWNERSKPAVSPLMTPVQSITRLQSTPPPPTSSFSVSTPPEPSPAPEEMPLPQEDTLESLLQNFLDETPDDDAAPDEPDAIPTEKMPQPVFVPLYEEIPHRRRRWLWLVPVFLLLFASAGFVLWKAGLLENILP